MKFYKDCEGLCFFLCVHFIFFIQIIIVHNISDNISFNNNSDNIDKENYNIILLLHKILFYIIIFITFYSHLKVGTTEPGEINYYNNIEILEFYYFIYKDIIELREEYKLNNKIKTEKENNVHYCTSDDEEQKLELKSRINDKMMNIINNKFKIKLNRCLNCYVVRPYNSHHCRTCKCCVLEEDHHCPWINNCIGIFNQKYFILFNFYAFISVIYCSSLLYYYSVFKNYKFFRNDLKENLIAIFWGLFAFIYGLFVLIMLIEQRDNVKKEFKKFRKDIDIRRKMMGIKMRIIFGGKFSIKWFLPFYEGGKRYILFYIKQKKIELYQMKKDKEKEKEKEKNE